MKARRTEVTCFLTLIGVFTLLQAVDAQPAPRFQRIGVLDGLSQSSVTAIAQDWDGFIWLGTQDGLNRFDGYEFQTFGGAGDQRRRPGLENGYIHDLLTDRDGMLWVASNGGVSRYDPVGGRFRTWSADPDDLGSLPSNTARTLYEDDDGRIWVGTFEGLVSLDPVDGPDRVYLTTLPTAERDVRAITQDDEGRFWVGSSRGLRLLDPTTGRVSDPPGGGGALGSALVWDLFRDADGTIWIGTATLGLAAFSPEDGTWTWYRADSSSLASDEVRRIFRDGEGRLWVGTGDGVNVMKPGATTFEVWRHEPSDPVSLSQSAVWAIAQDSGGLVWLGTMTGGVNVWDPRSEAFARYRHRPGDGGSIPDNVVYEILGDARGAIWVGTRDGGVARFDPESRRFSPLRYHGQDAEPRIVAMADDPRGWLWIATNQQGLHRVDPVTLEAEVYRHRPGDPSTLSSDRLRDVVVHPDDGSVWIGTSGAGLDRLDPSTGRFENFSVREGDPTSLSLNFVRGLYVDGDGAVWVATYGNGANRLDPETGEIRRYLHDPEDPTSLGSPFVRSITEDSRGRLWFSTDDGLSLLTEDGFVRYGVEDGLPNGVVYGVLEDDDGRLWASTNHGIAAFDPDSGRFTRFDADDGLQANEFNTNAFWQDPDGRMYFGGVEGLTVFHPDEVELNDFRPPVVLTEYRLYNRPVEPGDSAGLSTDITRARLVTVGPEDEMIGFTFSALGFRQPWKNRYRYRMEGFDDRWVETGPEDRRATFTHLPPARYTFVVQAANDDGLWNEAGARITVQVLPEYWQTRSFRIGLLLLAATLGLLGIYLWQQRLRTRNLRLTAAVDERTAELRSRTEELEASIQHIKRLEGILPICSGCKSIRVEEEGSEDEWVPVDAYITERTDAGFSHGLCPDCVERMYPDYSG